MIEYKQNLDLVSVIIPIFNSEKYLSRCIESILNQDYENLELILINDGSSDSSDSICLHYKNLDRRVQYIETKNNGVSHARNVGIFNSNGKYITFIDSDDFVERNFISELLHGLKTVNADLAMCNLNYYYFNRLVKKSLFNESNCLLNEKDKFRFLYDDSNTVIRTASCKLFKTEIIKNSDISFKKNISNGEDFIFCFEYTLHCKRIVSIMDKHLYFYRKDNLNSLTSNSDCGSWNAQKKIIIALKTILNEKKLNEYLPYLLLEEKRRIISSIEHAAENSNSFIDFCKKYQNIFNEVLPIIENEFLVNNLKLKEREKFIFYFKNHYYYKFRNFVKNAVFNAINK